MDDDLKLAVKTLQAKTVVYTPLFDYYLGNQPIKYAADRLRDIFQNVQTRFTENWCAVVVNAVLDRLSISHWSGGNDQLDAQLALLWKTTGLEADAEAIYRSTIVTGEAYVLAWANDDGLEAYYHDPRICHVWYSTENPRHKRMAAKWWQDDDGKWQVNLYYPDRIVHYLGGTSDLPQASGFQMVGEELNTAGVIPVFHLYRDRHLRQGELTNVVPLQDAVNKLLADMMIAAEFGAFRQRWIITNSDTSKLRNAPNEIWELPPGAPGEQPTSVGEFSSNDLGNYLNAVDRLANSIGVITQTPRHYFYGQGGDPSGEALIAMEAPLNRKVHQYQISLGRGWREIVMFLLQLSGTVVDSLTPVWTDAQTVQPRTQAEIRQMSVAAGMPLVTALRGEGWTEEKLAQMQADKDEEGAQQQTQLAQALMQAQQNFDQNVADGNQVVGTNANA